MQGEGPTGANPPECVPLWVRILSFPYRLIPWNFCLPGNLCWGGAEYAQWLETQYYPQLPSLLKWVWLHPAQAWGLPPTSLKTIMIENWFLEQGPEKLEFGPEHPATRLLMHHKGVEYYRQEFYRSGREGKWEAEGLWDAGEGAADLKKLAIEISAHLRIAYEIMFLIEDNPETIRGTIGTYYVTVKREGNEAVFEVYNLTGWESFTRTPWFSILPNQPREAFGPGGNFEQIFQWREPIENK